MSSRVQASISQDKKLDPLFGKAALVPPCFARTEREKFYLMVPNSGRLK